MKVSVNVFNSKMFLIFFFLKISGLIEYREWIYKVLLNDPKALHKKVEEYMTPLQIRNWVSNHTITIN